MPSKCESQHTSPYEAHFLKNCQTLVIGWKMQVAKAKGENSINNYISKIASIGFADPILL